MTYGKKYDTVIFDLDGTLLDTLDDLTAAVNYSMDKCGCRKRSKDEIKLFLGNGARRLIERALPPGYYQPEKALDCFRQYYAVHYADTTKPYPGMAELVGRLKKAGYKLAVISNKPDDQVKELCRKFFPDVPAFGDSGRFPLKPSPASLTYVIKFLESSSRSTLYVGDSKVDQRTARAAFIDCAIVRWGFGGVFLDGAYSPQLFVNRPEQLADYIFKNR